MISSVPIKKEIIRTFLKNISKPLEEVVNTVYLKINSTFLRNERVIYNSEPVIVLSSNNNQYLIKTTDSQLTVPHSSLKRALNITKNEIYLFLQANTSQTVFGRVLKLNAGDEIKKRKTIEDYTKEASLIGINNNAKKNTVVKKIEPEKKNEAPKTNESIKKNESLKKNGSLKKNEVEKSGDIEKINEIQKRNETQKQNEANKRSEAFNIRRKPEVVEQRKESIVPSERIDVTGCAFELFVFVASFQGFNAVYFEDSLSEFVNHLKDENFCYKIVKEFFKTIISETMEINFEELVKFALDLNKNDIEKIESGEPLTGSLSWKTTEITRDNYKIVISSFIKEIVLQNPLASRTDNINIFDTGLVTLLKILADIVMSSMSFRAYVDKQIEKLRMWEKEKHDLNARARKLVTELDEEKRLTETKKVCKRIEEVERQLLKNRIRPRIGRFENAEYFFVGGEIYTKCNDIIAVVKNNDALYNILKNKRDAAPIVSFCKSLRGGESMFK